MNDLLNLAAGGTFNVKAHGAIGDGTTNDTASFSSLIATVGEAGGGRIVIPPGTYLISELDIDYENVIIEGMTSGYGYEEPSAAVTLLCESGVYAIHLKHTSDTRRANLGGLKNLVVKSTSDVEYGVVVSCGGTVMDAVTVQGFQYGCSQVAGGNQNIYDRCTFVTNSKAGFTYTEIENGAAAYLHPNLTIDNVLTSTTITLRNCNIRRNEIGMIVRTGERLRLDGCVIESNEQYGTIIYKSNASLATRCAYTMFVNCWWENNYDDYTIDDTDFSITGINALKVDATTYINGDQTGAWASLGDAGYQVWMGSETEDFINGPPKHIRFVHCTLIGSGDQQHDARIRSARFVLFDTCEFRTGGNARPAGISLEDYASAVHFFNCEAEQQVALGEGTLTAVFRSQDGTTTFEDGGVAYEYGSVLAPRLIATEREEPGGTAITRTMPGVVLGAEGMNATNKYTPAILFMSSDPNFTTENPKLLGYIVGLAEETYGADTDGGMSIDIGTTPQSPGATNVPVARLRISSEGVVVVSGPSLQIDNALDHDGATAGFYGVAPIAQQTGVAVSAAGIHAALVALGLITA
jgi:hypothetical protein